MPVTLHQKALFLFWVSCLAIFLTLQSIQAVTKIQKRKRKSEDAKKHDVENTNETNAKQLLDDKIAQSFQAEPVFLSGNLKLDKML